MTGKRGLVFTSKDPRRLVEGSSYSVPCSTCIGCRVDRSRDWAARCMNEAQLFADNSFITLTYDDAHLPPDYSVHKPTWQNFMKRLRFSLGDKKVRFFACGEYGDLELRPHYHALLFNHRFTDQVFYKTSGSGEKIYTSESLSKVWQFGNAWVGTCTYRSAAYIARYVIKKIGGDLAKEHYLRVHPLTGKLHQVEPEFALQSRRPGLGYYWLQKFKDDVYPSDHIVVDGKRHPVPRFYIRKLSEEEQKRIKRTRAQQNLKTKADKTPARLKVREAVKLSQIAQLKREL